jgi:O-antigen/teichoic acid export membrane protein
LKILAFSVPPAALTMFFLAVTQGLKRMEYRTAIEKMAVPAVKIVAVLVGFWMFHKSTQTAASMVLAASLAGGVMAAYGAWRLYPLRGKAARPVYEARALLSFSWPLLLTSLLDRSNIQTETLVLGALLASGQVGIYYVGQRATILITAIFLAFNAITAPMMADLYGRGEHDRLAGLFKTTTRWGATLCLPVLILFLTTSREIMGVFGEGFLAGAAVLQVLSVAQFINVLTGPAGWLLIMTGHPRLNLLNTCLSLALNIGFALLLIPRLGILGAALGEAAAFVLVNLLRLAEAQRILKIHPYQASFWKPALAGLLSWASLAGVKILLEGHNSLVQLGASGLVLFSLYPALLWALGFAAEDRLLIRAFLNRAGRGLRRQAAV